MPLFFRANLIREPVVIVDLFALANGANGAKNARGAIRVSAIFKENDVREIIPKTPKSMKYNFKIGYNHFRNFAIMNFNFFQTPADFEEVMQIRRNTAYLMVLGAQL